MMDSQNASILYVLVGSLRSVVGGRLWRSAVVDLLSVVGRRPSAVSGLSHE